MMAIPEKAPKQEKKPKEQKQSEAQRLAGLRRNNMLYGPTAGELRPVIKKIDYGVSYLKHPKFQNLIAAFKKGSAFAFNVTDKDRVLTISTDESGISFDGKIVFYSRPLNRHEDNLLLDKTSTIHFQRLEAFVHFAFAVLKSFPELEAPPLSYLRHEFMLGPESLEAGIAEQGPNLLLGSFKHNHFIERPKK